MKVKCPYLVEMMSQGLGIIQTGQVMRFCRLKNQNLLGSECVDSKSGDDAFLCPLPMINQENNAEQHPQESNT